MKPKFKILMVTSECAPFAKSGGLGDMVAGLSKALKRDGHDVRILMPLYRSIDREKFQVRFKSSVCVHMGHHEENWGAVFESTLDGEVPVWFFEHDRFFGRGGIYDEGGHEYQDNAFRYALLSKSSLQICKDFHYIPDIMHCHDWMTALTPLFLRTWDRVHSPLSTVATVLTIHNIGYQGVYHPGVMGYLGVGDEYYRPDVLEDHGRVNLLKAGIQYSDAITTVSPTHAEEILGPIGGRGLGMYLGGRRPDLFGVLNGADYDHWSPETDKFIPAKFSAEDMSGKAECKRKLQERMGLEVNGKIPLIGIVSRFVEQKGFHLLDSALPQALDEMVMQVVVLGSGDQGTVNFFDWLCNAYKGRVGTFIGFDVELSHWIEAGSDFFLMPSMYEPCGLNQLYSMKYGTLPIVRATGGLEDTVDNYDEYSGHGTGFKFYLPTSDAVKNSIGWAVSTWFDRPHHIDQMRQDAMRRDFSWGKSAVRYEEVYRHAISKINPAALAMPEVAVIGETLPPLQESMPPQDEPGTRGGNPEIAEPETEPENLPIAMQEIVVIETEPEVVAKPSSNPMLEQIKKIAAKKVPAKRSPKTTPKKPAAKAKAKAKTSDLVAKLPKTKERPAAKLPAKKIGSASASKPKKSTVEIVEKLPKKPKKKLDEEGGKKNSKTKEGKLKTGKKEHKKTGKKTS